MPSIVNLLFQPGLPSASRLAPISPPEDTAEFEQESNSVKKKHTIVRANVSRVRSLHQPRWIGIVDKALASHSWGQGSNPPETCG